MLCGAENPQTRKMDADSPATWQTRKALGECRPPASNDKESLKEFRDRDGNVEHHQNGIICSCSHHQHFPENFIIVKSLAEVIRSENNLPASNKFLPKNEKGVNLECFYAVGLLEFVVTGSCESWTRFLSDWEMCRALIFGR